jgi:RNA polymerase sigma factor (sigma-70 family)
MMLQEIPHRTMPPSAKPVRAGLRLVRNLEAQRPSVAEPILHRVAAGEPGAVQECLERYGGLVWSLSRRFCPNREEAEDAVQEVFIEIWNKAKRYDASLSSEITFIAMIARRRLIDRGRRRQRALQTDVIEDENILPPAEDRSQEMVDIGDEVDRAQKALAKLRPDEQKVLRLSIYEGLSHDQISKATSLPLGTVKTHLRRGLIRVREMLGVDSSESGLREEPQEEGAKP